MRRIEEKAMDFATNNGEVKNSIATSAGVMAKVNGFMAGAKHVLTFISVTESLPEDNFKEHGIEFGANLLLKCPNGKVFMGKRVFSNSIEEFIWVGEINNRIFHVDGWIPLSHYMNQMNINQMKEKIPIPEPKSPEDSVEGEAIEKSSYPNPVVDKIVDLFKPFEDKSQKQLVNMLIDHVAVKNRTKADELTKEKQRLETEIAKLFDSLNYLVQLKKQME